MPARLVLGTLVAWERPVDVLITLGAVYGMARLGARIYAPALVRGGARLSWGAAPAGGMTPTMAGLGSPMAAPDGVQDHADERPDERSLHPSRADRGQGREPARDAVRREGIIATAQATGIRRALVAAAWAEGECGRSYRRFTVHGGLLPFLCSTSLCSMARALPPDRLVATRWMCTSSRLLPAAAPTS
jgi:hypothetical protein